MVDGTRRRVSLALPLDWCEDLTPEERNRACHDFLDRLDDGLQKAHPREPLRLRHRYTGRTTCSGSPGWWLSMRAIDDARLSSISRSLPRVQKLRAIARPRRHDGGAASPPSHTPSTPTRG